MITLAIDTSTACGAVALLRDDQSVAEEAFERDGLFRALQGLNPGNFDLIVVGVGPGSFTGIRAGIAAAKGLALQRRLPVKAVSSFDALALTALPQMPRDCQQMCVLRDARRDEVYFALYERDGQRAGEIRIASLESIADDMHNPFWFVSPEIERFRQALTEVFGGFASTCDHPVYPSAAALGRIGSTRETKLPLEPIYLREAEYKKA
jgi:tRNA threonylcarbamoyladenosine biosynthesis protein TsaB